MPGMIHIRETGGPEVLEWVESDIPDPGPNEVRLRHTAIGVNFVDVYFRRGVYPLSSLPYVPGAEGAGVVVAAGDGVSRFKPGDRVVYQVSHGAYAEERLIPAERLVKLPDDVDDKVAAAVFLKGVTVDCLIRRTFRVAEGQTILWHAAAGGVGLIACQWVSALGATVIGTAGSDEKAERARKAGATHVIIYRREDFVSRVKDLTDGIGVDAVYDSVGKDTFPGSLDCLKPLGMWVSFGQSSGVPPAFPVSLLQQKGSLFATRPTIGHYLAKRADLEASAASLFAALRQGLVTVSVNQEFPLRDAAEAHKALEARKTVGATVLVP